MTQCITLGPLYALARAPATASTPATALAPARTALLGAFSSSFWALKMKQIQTNKQTRKK